MIWQIFFSSFIYWYIFTVQFTSTVAAYLYTELFISWAGAESAES